MVKGIVNSLYQNNNQGLLLIFYCSFCLKSRRKIFPLADFGIESTSSTPPRNCLYQATLFDTYSLISFTENESIVI